MQTGRAEGRGNVCVPGATPGGSQCLLRRLYSPFLPLVQQCCMAGTNGYGGVRAQSNQCGGYNVALIEHI